MADAITSLPAHRARRNAAGKAASALDYRVSAVGTALSMMENAAHSLGRGLLRVLAVAVIVLGILAVMTSLTQGNVTGLVLGMIMVGVPGFLLSRSRRRRA